MHKGIEKLKKDRAFYITLLEGLTTEQLNTIPNGFNNNIIWNFGHLIATLQSICYIRAGIDVAIDEKYIQAYKPGTKPDQYVNEAEITTMKLLMISSIERFETDYNNHLFSDYKSWTTRTGIDVGDIEDAINYTFFHDGLHTGYTMALKRQIS